MSFYFSCSYDNATKVGDPVKFDELITFTTLPGSGGQVILAC